MLYYEHQQPKNDWWMKQRVEIVLREHPSYCHKRIALLDREIVGFNVMLSHSVSLTINVLLSAARDHPASKILHSDQDSEYISKDYIALTDNLGIRISMSKKGSPWENGYQEGFYS